MQSTQAIGTELKKQKANIIVLMEVTSCNALKIINEQLDNEYIMYLFDAFPWESEQSHGKKQPLPPQYIAMLIDPGLVVTLAQTAKKVVDFRILPFLKLSTFHLRKREEYQSLWRKDDETDFPAMFQAGNPHILFGDWNIHLEGMMSVVMNTI